MTEFTLVLDGGEIRGRAESGQTVRLTADQIYSYVFETGASSAAPGHEPASALPFSVGFSKIPAELSLVIESVSGDPSALVIRLQATTQAGDADVSSALTEGPDHRVINGEWYPFAPGTLDDVRALLSSAGVDQMGPVSLRQYLNLVRNLSSPVPISDETAGTSYAANVRATDLRNIPPSLQSVLYPYQADGVTWLSLMAKEGLGCVLADEMGLGKTLQAIALLLGQKGNDCGPSLVIAPTTLLENWQRELDRFAPDLTTLVHRGSSRTGLPGPLRSKDVVITSYDTAAIDRILLKQVHWNLMILDEAQAVRNPATKRAESIRSVPRRVSIAVTGTPLQNSLVDLWAIIDLVLPDYLGRLSAFKASFPDAVSAAARLEPLVSPLMLRRRVSDVAKDLPDRIDIPQALVLGEEQAKRYEDFRQQLQSESRGRVGLSWLTPLRQFCTHPFLICPDNSDPAEASPKYRRLVEILEEILEHEEKTLIFTSYTKMIDLLVTDLRSRLSIFTDWIDGRVPGHERQSRVDRFNSYRGPAVLVLNPAAAGVGLNITGANHVVHYNPEWNPAVEDQASARAWRRGQTLPVTVHQLFYVNTLEEVMVDRITRKRQIAETAVTSTDPDAELRDLLAALRTSPARTEQDEDEYVR